MRNQWKRRKTPPSIPTSYSDEEEKTHGVLALWKMEKEAKRCHRSLRRKNMRLELPEQDEIEEGEEIEGRRESKIPATQPH